MRAYPNPSRRQIHDLATLVAGQKCDVLLLQECLRPWLRVICEATEMVGAHAHDLPPDTPRSAFPPDGCAIAVSPLIELGGCRRIAPGRFKPDAVQRELFEPLPEGFAPMPERLAYRSSGRSILAELVIDDERITVGSFHATPGTGKVGGVSVGEWKPFFNGALALELAAIESPFVFAIDANEPLSETIDSVTFHWEEGRPGARKLQALLGLEPIHRGRDLLRRWLTTSGRPPASANLLDVTYAPTATFQRRFDSIWATPEFALSEFATHLEDVVGAGGDHAMLVADLRLGATSAPYDASPTDTA